ncbi:MAG: hypothetical protein WD557_14430 [Dehalococcoidia bacterium]
MQRLQPYLFQPVPSRLPFSLNDVVEEVRASLFPEVEERVEVRITTETRSIAAIWYHLMGRDRHVVAFHPLLNHPEMPIEIIRFIAKHELTHIVRPGDEDDGHPPAFWAHEYHVAPERWAAWHWIHANLGRYARLTQWGFRVFRTWPRLEALGPFTPGLLLQDDRWAFATPDDGQMQLPPTWAPRPLPLDS